MRDAPDRQLQLDFQRRAPELAVDGSSLAARASVALHGARLTSVLSSQAPFGVFFRSGGEALLTSDAPNPLPRHRVNDDGFNANPEHLRSVKHRRFAAAGFRLRRLGSRNAAVSRNRRRAGTSTTALTNFCNRCKPEHTGKRSQPGASRRSGGAPGYPVRRRETPAHRPFRSRVSAVQGTAAG